MSIAALPTTPKRPGLAFQYAFDWLAQRLHATEGPTACVLNHPLHKVEMMSRIPSLPVLPKEQFGLADAKLNLPAIGWVLPQKSGADTLATIKPWLQIGGYLHVVAAGPLVSFLDEQQKRTPAFVSASQIMITNGRSGWKVREHTGLHGIHGVFWHLMGTAVGTLGHTTWQDRCHFGMRRSFVERGYGRYLTALACITLERTK